jgi:hypothetical protein
MMKPAGQAIFARLTKPIQLLSLKGTQLALLISVAQWAMRLDAMGLGL